MPIPHITANSMLKSFLESGPLYIGLFKTMPTKEGSNGIEVNATSYARRPITFGAPTNSIASNTQTINFPQATESWGTVTGFGLFDTQSGGTLKWWGSFPQESQLNEGSFFFVNAGGISIGIGL